MSDHLSFQEQLTVEIFMNQSDEQLGFNYDRLINDLGAFDFVDFMISSKDAVGFMVPKDFYIMALLNEVSYRGLI